MNWCPNFYRHSVILACLPLCAAPGVLAQATPDAGQVLRELTAPAAIAPRPSVGIQLLSPPSEPTLPGGQRVTLKAVRIKGNSVFSDSQLLNAMKIETEASLDLAGLRGLAEQVAEIYHASGFPFARAFLPPQNLNSGELVIEVVEGRYGEVRATGDAALAPQAQVFLSRLHTGSVMESRSLERATLILEDQPGVRTSPLLRPGAKFGTGNLEVDVQPGPAVRGDVGYDNHGNRYTGEHRLRTNMWLDSPFMLGDQIQINVLTTSEHLWLGSMGYSMPIGGDGWRALVSYAQTTYALGKELAASDAKGDAKVWSAGASYPVVRSQGINLTASASLQRKMLQSADAATPTEHWSSDAVPLTLQFDRRDGFVGGGVTYGNLVYTPGKLQLQGDKWVRDFSSGMNANGSFQKLNLDMARIQATSVTGLTLFARYSGQAASKNLDSSEKFGLGGPQGVRAYSMGAAHGDNGWLAQLELRYEMGAFNPYAFYDAGSLRINANSSNLMSAVSNNQRSIAGFGWGTRYAQGPWTADAALAWHTQGNDVEDMNNRQHYRGWLTISHKF